MTATLTPTTPRPVPSTPSAPARGRPELIALGLLLAGTAALYLIDLGASGYANTYYAAAVQSMTRSWEAFLFGSLDAGNVVTVDKPPASLWLMAASARIFGFSSWSMLVPQALCGVGSVALLYAAVWRVAGWVPALLAGAVLALTPVAALMFRFNNPDALLVLLMVAAAYATVRAIERAGTRWLLLAGVFIGFAFLTKMMQGFIVLPALVLAYLVAAPTGFWRRVRQLCAAAAAVLVSAGWYVALVELWPASSRPYIGGSTNNSILELALGYNGLSRIFGRGFGGDGSGAAAPAGQPAAAGAATPPAGFPDGGVAGGPGGPGGAGGPGGFGGQAGLSRLFSAEIGGQIAWLLPAALVLLVVGLWLTRRRARTDRIRASLLVWGGWTVVTALVFSLAEGIFHPYYTVALAPGMAALIGIGGHQLWQHRGTWPGRLTLAALTAGTGVWAWVLLDRSAEFLPWLRWVIMVVAVVIALALLVPRGGRRWATTLALASVLTGIAAPAAYAVQTAATPHTGSIPSAGPTVTSESGMTRFDGAGRNTGGDDTAGGVTAGGGTTDGGMAGGRLAGGGPGENESVDPALVTLLQQAGTTWSAATVSGMGGASLALASDTTVMSIGGFSGSDPAPTLAQFQAYVAAGEVRYFVVGGGPGGGGPTDGPGAGPEGGTSGGGQQSDGSARADRTGRDGGFPGRGGAGSEISAWVEQTFTPTTVGARTVYDLTQPRT
ncbi:MAG TPA: glycosyltransferase family 39 protein [Pseudonocardia sp.]|nr:glycosyltransferase family 39 protein [Pseudonocardia sp.]